MALLTQREAALALRLSERTLERWRVAGIGPSLRSPQPFHPLSPTRPRRARRGPSSCVNIRQGGWKWKLKPRHPQRSLLYLAK